MGLFFAISRYLSDVNSSNKYSIHDRKVSFVRENKITALTEIKKRNERS